LAERRMERQELSVAHFVFSIRRRVNEFYDVAFGDQAGIYRFGVMKILGKVECAGHIDRAPKVKTEFVVDRRTNHAL
jgi:hypothetical protein